MKYMLIMLISFFAAPLVAMNAGWADWHANRVPTAQETARDKKQHLTHELCDLIAKTNPEEQEAAITKMQELLDQGADLTLEHKGTRCTPLAYAVCRGLIRTAQFLISKGADVHATCGRVMGTDTMLAIAATSYQLEMCRFLIEHNIDINEKMKPFGFTALMMAAGQQSKQFAPCALPEQLTDERKEQLSIEICQMLIDAGANINAHECGGRTALSFADSNERLFNFLLAKGAPPSPLYSAALFNHPRTIALQIALGTYPDEWDSNGCSALIIAAEKLNSKNCTLLLDAGANPWKKDNSGKTALDHAQEKHKEKAHKIRALIESYQRNPLSLKQLCINKARRLLKRKQIAANEIRELPEELREYFRV